MNQQGREFQSGAGDSGTDRSFSLRTPVVVLLSLFVLSFLFSSPLLSQGSEGADQGPEIPGEAPSAAAGSKQEGERMISPGEREARAVREIEKQGERMYQYGLSLFSGGELRRSLDLFHDFLLLYQNHRRLFQVQMHMAEIQEKLDRPRKAVEFYLRAYRQEQNSRRGAMAYLKAGRILAELGEKERARKIFSRLIEKRPFTRISRLASVELKSLRFLDVYEEGLDAVENRSRTEESPSSLPSTEKEKPLFGSAPAEKPSPDTGGEAATSRKEGEERLSREKKEALDRMGEGVEEF